MTPALRCSSTHMAAKNYRRNCTALTSASQSGRQRTSPIFAEMPANGGAFAIRSSVSRLPICDLAGQICRWFLADVPKTPFVRDGGWRPGSDPTTWPGWQSCVVYFAVNTRAESAGQPIEDQNSATTVTAISAVPAHPKKVSGRALKRPITERRVTTTIRTAMIGTAAMPLSTALHWHTLIECGSGIGIYDVRTATPANPRLHLRSEASAIHCRDSHRQFWVDVTETFNRRFHPPLHWLARIAVDGLEEIERRCVARHLDLIRQHQHLPRIHFNTHPSLTGCLECVMERIYPRSATPARPGARIHPPGLWAYRPAPKVHGLVFEFARRWDTPLLFFLGKSPIDQCDILRVVPIKVSFVRSSASRNSRSANLTGKGY
jgi:hypothetical protein